MKRLFSPGWILILVMLMTVGVFADQKPVLQADYMSAADGSQDINWNAETVDATALRDETLAYHDGSFEGQLGTSASSAFAVRFSVDTPVFLTGLTLYTQGDAAAIASTISIYVDEAAGVAGPPSQPVGPGDGTALWESELMDFSSPDQSLQQFDITFDNLPVMGGDYYIVIWDNGSGFMGIANDLQMNYVDRNWVSLGAWSTLSDATGGDATLTGNFGITSTFIYQDIDGSYMNVGPQTVNFGVLDLNDGAVTQDVTITNLGNADFDVTAIAVDGADYSTALAVPVTVTAGTSVIMDVTLTPTTTGAAAGTFTITSDADNATEAIVTSSAMVFDGFPDYLIWNPSSSASGQALLDGITALGHTAALSPDLFMFGPPAEVGYQAVFVTLGMYGDGNYVLVEASPEVTALVDYAFAGNPIYMEGGDTWAYNPEVSLHGFFGIDGTSDGGSDLEIVEGETLMDGMDYGYTGVNSFVDHLAPASPDAVIFHTNPADGEACGIGNLSPGANTIGNSFEFGGLTDSTSLVSDLLADYLEFLAMPYTDLWPPSIAGVTTFTYTLDTDGPYTIEAYITDNVGVDFAIMFYNINGGTFTSVSMTDDGAGVYTADIPGQVVGSTVGYYIMAVDEEGNEGYSPEEAPAALFVFDVVSHLPPTFVEAISGLDGQVDLTWLAPGTEAPPLLDCADFAIDDLPFTATGSTVGMGNDFDVNGSDNDDVAYQLNVGTDATYTISLCNGTDYDSKLEVFTEDCITSTGYYNDDACGLQSELTGVFLTAGTYLIVIDGYSTAAGNYTLDVFEEGTRSLAGTFDIGAEVSKLQNDGILITPELLSSSPREFYSVNELRELTNYGIYRNTTSPVLIEAGNQVDVVGVDPMAYSDNTVTNGTDYFYRISAIYDDGEAAAGEVTATPINHNPEPITGLEGVVDDMTVTLSWNENIDYDFDHYNIYRNDVNIGGSSVASYTDVLTTGGYYSYVITAVDAEDAESTPSPILTLPVGNLPPMYPTAESGMDGQVYLTWMEPGVMNMNVSVEIFTDNYPGETTWDIIDETGVVIATDEGIINTPATVYNWDVELTPATYIFTIYDAFGDGICCTYGEGYYNLLIDGNLIATGGDFASSESVTFGGAGMLAMHRTGYDAEPQGPKGAAPSNLAELNIIEELVFENLVLQNFDRERDLTSFVVYRDGVDISGAVTTDTYEYTDGYIPNGVEYCYEIEAVYDTGGNSMSVMACATPENWAPLAPENLTFVIDDHNIALTWDANSDYDFASYNVYRDAVVILNTTDTTFTEDLPISNIYRYYVTAIDAEDAESSASNTVILPVGNLPPAAANAESGLDGGVMLSWLPPGTMGGEGLYEDFESGIFPPADWSALQTNANASWMLYDDILGAPAFEGVFSAGVWWDYEHQDEWLFTPELSVGAGDVLTFWAYGYQGSESGDHYYVKASTDGGLNWDELLDLSALPPYDNPENPGWNTWLEPYTVDLSDYAGQSVQLAWQAIDGDGQGLWYVWMLDAITVGPSDGVATFAANTGLWGVQPENAARENADQLYHIGEYTNFEPVFINSPVREMRSEMAEYQIFRSLTSPVAVDVTPYAVVDTNSAVAGFEYYDFVPLINGTDYYYIIGAWYPDDTELSLSPELIGTPMNHAPAAPVGLTGAGDEDSNVVLDWDDNTEYDMASYNVYRDDVMIANVAVSTFSEVMAEAGVYEYVVTAIDAEDAESEMSEEIDVPTGPLPPERLRAESGMDGQVLLTWSAPGDMMPGLLDCGDVLIESMPYEAAGSNVGTGNDFDVSGSDGDDVAYQLWMPDDGVVTVTLCSELTNFDTKLEIFNADCITSTGLYNDDSACEYSGLYSTIEGAFLPEGVYLIVVDGFGGATGDYGISVTFDDATVAGFVYDQDTELDKLFAAGLNPEDMDLSGAEIRVPQVNNEGSERSFDGFQVYRDGVAVSEVLTTDTYSYLDGWNVGEDLDNGTEYCYTIASVYTSATTHSNIDCAIPLNHAPSIPQNVTATVNDVTDEVSVDWDDVLDYDLTGYNVYVNDEMHVFETGSQFAGIFNDGTYSFRIKALDAGGMESDASQRVLVIVGEAPPENLSANGNFDDHIELSWREPGGGEEFALSFDDGVLANSFYFYATFEDGFAHGTRFDPVDSYDVVSASVKILSEGDQYWPWPNDTHGPIRVMVLADAGGVPGTVIFDEEVVTEDGWATVYPDAAGLTGPFYVIASHVGDWQTAGDPEGYGVDGAVDYPDNMVTMQDGMWTYGDVLGYGGDYMHRATIFGQGVTQMLSGDNPIISKDELMANREHAFATVGTDLIPNPDYIPTPSDPVIDWSQISTEESLRDISIYNVFRDGDLLAQTTETSYSDPVGEDVVYMYEVTATYSNGEDSGPSDMVEASANMAPAPPTSVSSMVTGHLVSLEWVDPIINMDGTECIDLEGIRILRDGVEIGVVDIYEWTFNDAGVSDGPHHYELIGFDEVPNYGESVGLDVWIGPAPYILEILTDNYPTEISWDIVDANGTIADGIGSGDLTSAGTLYTWLLDLVPGNYVFTIYDSYGDGIYDPAYYQIVHGEEIVVGPGGGSNGYDTSESTPFTVEEGLIMGDLNGDGVLDILDISRLIEIVTLTGEPVTPDELAVLDINGDGAYNVLDVVILIEAVLNMPPGLAKDAPIIEDVAVVVEPVSLLNNREWQNIPVTVTYEGLISGFQADLVFDATVIELGIPTLAEGNENVALYTSLTDNTMRVLAIDLTGGQIDLSSGLLMDVPVQVIDENATGATDFAVEDLILSGAGGVEIECECLVSIIDIGLPAPTEFSLMQNYPNPFNPTTNIRYDIAEAGVAQLVIYNMLGQQVRTLVSGTQAVGRYEVLWNGLDESGEPVAAGIYIYHLQAGNYSRTHKMAYIK